MHCRIIMTQTSNRSQPIFKDSRPSCSVSLFVFRQRYFLLEEHITTNHTQSACNESNQHCMGWIQGEPGGSQEICEIRETFVSANSVQNNSWEESKCVEKLAAIWVEGSCRGCETLSGFCPPSATSQALLYLGLLITQSKHMLTHMCANVQRKSQNALSQHINKMTAQEIRMWHSPNTDNRKNWRMVN